MAIQVLLKSDGVGRCFGRRTDRRDIAEDVAVTLRDERHFSLAQPCRGLGYHLQHGFEVESRTADDLEHFCDRRLVFERLFKVARAHAQLAQEPRILDGNDRLSGKILHQRNLLIVERAYLLSKKDERTDYFALLEHWHSQDRAIAAELGSCHRQRVAFKVRLLDRDVGGLRDPLGRYRTAKGYMRIGPHW